MFLHCGCVYVRVYMYVRACVCACVCVLLYLDLEWQRNRTRYWGAWGKKGVFWKIKGQKHRRSKILSKIHAKQIVEYVYMSPGCFCAFVCVCVWERVRERERGRKRWRETWLEKEGIKQRNRGEVQKEKWWRERVCVYTCVLESDCINGVV